MNEQLYYLNVEMNVTKYRLCYIEKMDLKFEERCVLKVSSTFQKMDINAIS